MNDKQNTRPKSVNWGGRKQGNSTQSINWGGRALNVVVALALLLALLPLASAPAPARAHPLLLQLAAEQPDQMVRVIVQKAAKGTEAEQMIATLGGEVTQDLHIINAFAAEMSASAATELARSASVRWVSLDAPVASTGGKPGGGGSGGGGQTSTTTYTMRDNFSTVAFSNNDGIAEFATEWLEHDPAGSGPAVGNAYVAGGELVLQDNLTATPTLPSVEREADLSSWISNAVLSYSFRFGPGAVNNQDKVRLEISTDGGATYTTLSTLSYNGGTTGTAYSTINNYVSPETRFRFRVLQGFNQPGVYFAFDNFQIEYIGGTLPPNVYVDTLGLRDVWAMGYTGAGIGVAVIDSGVSNDRDFNSLARWSFNTNSQTPNDVYGHGTHVAGIIAGDGVDSGGQYKGVAPDVDLYSLKINDENGMAYESDTVAALQWVLDNKDAYNIRVVNLSIQSAVEVSYHNSPLAAAAEILWFNGVVVVAATGNWSGGAVYPLNAPPGNDPFVITVGATDEKGTTRVNDDVWMSSSVFGNTQDGHFKPEIWAPGKDIYSVLARSSEWETQHPERTVSVGGQPQYFRISGTSMATPMVSGAVALLLQAEPNLTPDQVKYRVTHATNWVSGLPYLSVKKMLTTPTTASANTGIQASQLLWTGSQPVNWNSVDWNSVDWNSVDWNSVDWNSVDWNSVDWNSVDWGN